jgi:hypothetical protein
VLLTIPHLICVVILWQSAERTLAEIVKEGFIYEVTLELSLKKCMQVLGNRFRGKDI